MSFFPRMPWQRTWYLPLAVRRLASASREFSRSRRAARTCPDCGAPALTADGALLVCAACGWEQDRTEIIAQAYRDGDDQLGELMRAQWICLAAAAIFPMFGVFWYWWLSEWPTLVSTLFAMPVAFLMACLFRFRSWMIIHRRMFEKNVPWRDWLRDEFSSLPPDEKQ